MMFQWHAHRWSDKYIIRPVQTVWFILNIPTRWRQITLLKRLQTYPEEKVHQSASASAGRVGEMWREDVCTFSILSPSLIWSTVTHRSPRDTRTWDLDLRSGPEICWVTRHRSEPDWRWHISARRPPSSSPTLPQPPPPPPHLTVQHHHL